MYIHIYVCAQRHTQQTYTETHSFPMPALSQISQEPSNVFLVSLQYNAENWSFFPHFLGGTPGIQSTVPISYFYLCIYVLLLDVLRSAQNIFSERD